MSAGLEISANPTPVRTGIEGLDSILHGGIPRKNVILVKGAAGTGKTLLGIEFIYRGIVQFDEPGLIVVFETSPDKMIRDAANFGWDLRKLQSDKKLQIIFTSPEVLDQEMRSPDSLLLETAIEMGAQRIFIDGIGLLRQSAPLNTASPKEGSGSYRELLQQLMEGLDRENLTALLSHESGGLADSSYSMEAATYLADTVLELKRSRSTRRIYRTIEIVKSRGQNYDEGEHTLCIADGQGLQVFRRVQSPVPRNLLQPSSMARRSVIGVAALDDLIGGGVFEGSVTMVIGISGVGKTILGTQLLIEGSNNGQRGLLISLDEHPAQIERNAATLGLELERYVEAGDIQILFESPQELNVDMHFDQITKAVEKYNIKRVVIDGMTSYSSALADHSVYRDFMHARWWPSASTGCSPRFSITRTRSFWASLRTCPTSRSAPSSTTSSC